MKRKLFAESIPLGGGNFVDVTPWSPMTNYEKISIPNFEKISIPQGPFTRSRVLYEYDICDIFYYMDLNSCLPTIGVAIDSTIEWTVEGFSPGSPPDFVIATVYVYDQTLKFALSCDIEFWGSSFFHEKRWFELFIYRMVRRRWPTVNWLIRKAFINTIHHPEVRVNVQNSYVECVFNNKDLTQFIAYFL